jgi:hypothetical protein
MDLKEFKSSLSAGKPPAGISAYLEALWYDAKGNWEQAHNTVQDISGSTASQIHAYLHRKEGDARNAQYWYNRAGHAMPDYSLEKEWEEIAVELLSEPG